MQDTEEYPDLILKVHVPVLDEGVPPEWTISLVDNPGFGEASKWITQVADASLVASSAYIYLIQAEGIEGTAAADFFTELHKKDPSKAVQLYPVKDIAAAYITSM